jgi:hypothetical protein
MDTIIAQYKDGSAKLADHLCQRSALRNELLHAADEAEAGGFQDIAELFQEMAGKLGASAARNGKESTAAARKRGRPPKQADDPTSVT